MPDAALGLGSGMDVYELDIFGHWSQCSGDF